ncbi:nucleotide exchange factor GrpE [Frankia sp. CiP1_Cm_nod2]|uniref:nucleotide exchange factor GrpE n=1 Tax=Frankia sp. CiP1_Cm_nod2 TaxID=2897161 RepID=UPI0020256EDC
MTTTQGEVTLASLSERLDGLTDLFKRRLLDDRDKRAVIEELQARLRQAEEARAAESLRPLVTRIALLVERLETTDATEDLRGSVIEELKDVLESFGVTSVAVGDTVDPRRHEIVSVTGEGPELRVGRLVRAGYEKDGFILRPARITAVRVTPDPVPADPPADPGSGGGE